MKKTIALAVIATLLLSGCAGPETICGTTYKPYGIFNPEDRNPNVRYEVSVGSVVAGIIFFETIFVPVIAMGWDLYKPVGLMTDQPGVKGTPNCGTPEG